MPSMMGRGISDPIYEEPRSYQFMQAAPQVPT
jgi:hypothetical protein